MARFLENELRDLIPGPVEQSGRNLRDLDIPPTEASLSYIISGVEDRGTQIARDTIDRAGAMGSWAQGELWQRIAACPATGLPDHVAGLRSSLEDLARIDRYTLPAYSDTVSSWLDTVGSVAGKLNLDQTVRFQNGSIRFDAGPLVGALGDLAAQRLANVTLASLSAIPYAGWIVGILFSVGRAVAGASIDAMRIQEDLQDRATWARPSGLCGIAPDTGGQDAAAWHTTADRLVLENVMRETCPVPVREWFQDNDLIPLSDQGMANAAQQIDLTFALSPANIPTGYMSRTPTSQTGTAMIGIEDQDCGQSANKKTAIFPIRFPEAPTGSGYCPGLGRMVGRPVFVGRPARRNTGTEGAVLAQREIGDLLSASTAFCRQAEGLVMSAPWCFQVRTLELERRWKDAISGWRVLNSQGFAMDDIPGAFTLPQKTSRGVRLIGRERMTAAPWLLASRVKLRKSNGDLYTAIRPGPRVNGHFGGLFQTGEARAKFAASPFSLEIADQIDEFRYNLREYFDGFEIWSSHPAGHSQAPGATGYTIDDPFLDPNTDLSDFEQGASFATYGNAGDPMFREYAHPQQDWLELGPGTQRRKLALYDRERLAAWEKESSRVWPVWQGDSVFWKDPTGTFSATASVPVETMDIFKGVIEPWLYRVRKIQWEALDTLACAYTSHGAPAFDENPFLKQRLFARRQQLLTHPARFQVRMNDVVDDRGEGIFSNFRKVLRSYGVNDPSVMNPDIAPTDPGGGTLGLSQNIDVPPDPEGPGFTVQVYDPPDPMPEPPPPSIPAPPSGGVPVPASEPDPAVVPTEPKEGKDRSLLIGVAALAAGAVIAREAK